MFDVCATCVCVLGLSCACCCGGIVLCCVVGRRGVCVGAFRSSLWHSKTLPCVHSKRLHVCRQNARVSCDTRASSRHAQKRFECTHDERLKHITTTTTSLLRLHRCERGVVDQRPDSSFAEAHKGFCSEPIHIEDEVKDQEDEVEMGETNEECEERVEERSNTQARDSWTV